MERQPENENPLAAEVKRLRERVADLEAQIAEREAGDAILGQERVERRALLDALPACIFIKSRDHRYLVVNQMYADQKHLPVEAIIGKRDEEVFPPETARTYHDSDEALMATGIGRGGMELPFQRADGSSGWTLENNVPLRDQSGAITGMVGVTIDVSETKQAQVELQRIEVELRAALHRQSNLLETITALSTPILPINDHVLAVPLVGQIDTARSARIIEALLSAVQSHHAEIVIIDLTGVPFVDTAVAGHIIRATQAVRLLGAQSIVVGMSPTIAQSLAQAGIDLRGLVTLGDLQAGVRYALAREQQKEAMASAPLPGRPR